LQPKLIDNFRVEHKLIQLYILNGRGERQSPINLDKGDRVWFAAEFADAAEDITTARIVFRNGTQLRAPIKQPEQ
jgi:sRNA-binding regulator protein Hfq